VKAKAQKLGLPIRDAEDRSHMFVEKVFTSRSHKFTGIDISRAKQEAADRGVAATFLVIDTLTLKAAARSTSSTTRTASATSMRTGAGPGSR
jgi:hypothetical protein